MYNEKVQCPESGRNNPPHNHLNGTSPGRPRYERNLGVGELISIQRHSVFKLEIVRGKKRVLRLTSRSVSNRSTDDALKGNRSADDIPKRNRSDEDIPNRNRSTDNIFRLSLALVWPISIMFLVTFPPSFLHLGIETLESQSR